MENVTLSLDHRITTYLLNHYYGIVELLENSDNVEMVFNLITSEDMREEMELNDENYYLYIEEYVDNYVQNLKGTIDEIFSK